MVLEWIEFEVESKEMGGITYENGVPVAKMRDKKPDEKDRLREHLMEKHDGAAHLGLSLNLRMEVRRRCGTRNRPYPTDRHLPEEQLSGNTMSLGDVLKGMTTNGEEV